MLIYFIHIFHRNFMLYKCKLLTYKMYVSVPWYYHTRCPDICTNVKGPHKKVIVCFHNLSLVLVKYYLTLLWIYHLLGQLLTLLWEVNNVLSIHQQRELYAKVKTQDSGIISFCILHTVCTCTFETSWIKWMCSRQCIFILHVQCIMRYSSPCSRPMHCFHGFFGIHIMFIQYLYLKWASAKS